jgi:hypothetical protein
MRKGEGSGARAGSVPLTNRSGSGSTRSKNMRTLRIRFRIRIPNTAIKTLRIENQIPVYIALGLVYAFYVLSLSLCLIILETVLLRHVIPRLLVQEVRVVARARPAPTLQKEEKP